LRRRVSVQTPPTGSSSRACAHRRRREICCKTQIWVSRFWFIPGPNRPRRVRRRKQRNRPRRKLPRPNRRRRGRKARPPIRQPQLMSQHRSPSLKSPRPSRRSLFRHQHQRRASKHLRCGDFRHEPGGLLIGVAAALTARARFSVFVGRIAPVEHALERRPFQRAMRPFRALCVRGRRDRKLLVRSNNRFLRRARELAIASHGQKLGLARTFEPVNVIERLPDGGAARQQSMIAKNHHLAVAEVVDKPLLLVKIDRHALEVMIRNARPAQCALGQRQQSAFERRDRHARIGMSCAARKPHRTARDGSRYG